MVKLMSLLIQNKQPEYVVFSSETNTNQLIKLFYKLIKGKKC